jgi:hypothetical protein
MKLSDEIAVQNLRVEHVRHRLTIKARDVINFVIFLQKVFNAKFMRCIYNLQRCHISYD